MYRIYFDENAGDHSGRWMGVPLWDTMRQLDVWALAGK